MTTEENEVPLEEIKYTHPPKDHLLTDFIVWANKGLSVGITLSVKGTIYSGKIIGGAHWCDLMAEQISSAFQDGETKEAVKDHFNNIKKEIYSDTTYDYDLIEFIHLESVKVYQGSQLIPAPDTVWRLKVGEVDGFSIGYWS